MSRPAPELTPTQARQARKGMGVYRILLVSLALVVIGFAIIWAVYAGRLSGHGGQAAAPPSAAAQVQVTPNAVTHNATNAAPGSVPAQTTTPPARDAASG